VGIPPEYSGDGRGLAPVALPTRINRKRSPSGVSAHLALRFPILFWPQVARRAGIELARQRFVWREIAGSAIDWLPGLLLTAKRRLCRSIFPRRAFQRNGTVNCLVRVPQSHGAFHSDVRLPQVSMRGGATWTRQIKVQYMALPPFDGLQPRRPRRWW